MATLGWGRAAAAHLSAGMRSRALPSSCHPWITCQTPEGICTAPAPRDSGKNSASLCFAISIPNKNSYYNDPFLPQGCRERNQIMSSNHLEFIVLFSSLTAHWNHLGNFKNTEAWVPLPATPQRFRFLSWDVTWASGLHRVPHVVLMDSQG